MTSIVTIDLRPYCGFPGKPYRSKISPEAKLVYADGEVVSYQCLDYWAAPMERKCVKGQWIGPMARCGDFIKDVFMQDAQCFDMSRNRPRQLFHYTNMNITNTNWKYPNAFTSNRFKAARLRIVDDHEYLWKFNFTKPITKLFVKVNFNFMNFTLLPVEVQKGHRFNVELEISPYRTCTLDYQNYNPWRDNGNRIDTYFTCEAPNYKAILEDADNPPNYMIMRTRSTLNITHEFVALFFGRPYGNDTEPLCGEPETDYGQSFRANVEFRDYVLDCANKEDWINVSPSKRFSFSKKCIGDMVWNGTAPRCVPTKTCSLDGSIFFHRQQKNQVLIANNSNSSMNTTSMETSTTITNDQKSFDPAMEHLVVDSMVNYYHFIDNDTIYATVGAELTYSCDNVDYILIGKETRKCKIDRTWTGNEPICKFIKSTNELIESSNTLLIVIVVMGLLLILIIAVSCTLFIIYTKRLKAKAAANGWENELNLYDNIDPNSGEKQFDSDGGVYEVYERVDEYTGGNEYTSFNDQAYGYAMMNDMNGRSQYGNVNIAQQHQRDSTGGKPIDSDYVQMLRESRTYQHLNVPGSNRSIVINVRNDHLHHQTNKRSTIEEPSYLELSK